MISKRIIVLLLLLAASLQFAEGDFKPVCIHDPDNYQWAIRVDSCAKPLTSVPA
ncbi:hypothetical protein [Pedobacter nutrimenti]|uniref:hypothetical protein n=1 Tax=Pedobacter nutrimenti TaxID=1241337 RepID=UPI00292E5E25|nr:hypothetical protein [Pedobacter nutrimenti]